MAIDQVDRTVVTQGPTLAAGQETVRTDSRHTTRTGPACPELTRRVVVLVFGLIQIVIGARIVLLNETWPGRVAHPGRLSTWDRYADALELGPDIMAAEVNRALFARAIGGNVRACISILKRHPAWSGNGRVRGPPSLTDEERARKKALIAEVNEILNRRPSTP